MTIAEERIYFPSRFEHLANNYASLNKTRANMIISQFIVMKFVERRVTMKSIWIFTRCGRCRHFFYGTFLQQPKIEFRT